jgi:preprotein translocase subunit SecY
VPFKQKALWTVAVLAAYFALTNVLIFGLAGPNAGSDLFGQFRSILAGAQGSILQLGIGPIVTASIVLQLLGGSDLLDLDMQDPRDQQLYQGLQKLLVFVMIILTGAPLVFSGTFLPASGAIAAQLGISLFALQCIMFAQVAVGGVLILYMDEVVSKWGLGSGVGLFIIAGVSQALIGGVFSQILPGWYNIITGAVQTTLLSADGLEVLFLGQGYLLAILTTLLIFAIVVYAESVRVEIPLSHQKVKGARGKFPVKLIYASVLPMILVRALQMNIQMVGTILNQQLGDNMPAILGVYSNGQPVGGLFYYLAPIQRPQDWMWWAGSTAAPYEALLRVGIDLFIMVVGGAVFALFWIRTSGMDSESVANQIKSSGMQIPGFRRNRSVMEKVVDRYIPYVTILGGAIVGVLAVFANMLGTIGAVSGTGLLLMVSITFKLYEQIAEEQMMENPMLRKLLK